MIREDEEEGICMLAVADASAIAHGARELEVGMKEALAGNPQRPFEFRQEKEEEN